MRLVVLDGRADTTYRCAWARRLHLEKVYRFDESEEEAHIEINLYELLSALHSFVIEQER